MAKTLQEIFNDMPTRVVLDWHDEALREPTEEILKAYEDSHGFRPEPSMYHPIVIQWSEKGRGFGEYVFYQKDGKIYCDNECDRRETVKRILCQMVDQAIFRDEVKNETRSPATD